jgi:hypothetical protein
MVPLSTDTIPTGHSSSNTSKGHTTAVQRTISSSGRRARPGCTRYQWPSSMPSEIDPRKAAPARVRSTDNNAGSPAAMPAATRPGMPSSGATRSRTGGNSAAVRSAASGCRSMPVMAATRAERRSASARCPATPALRRWTDTTSAPTAAPATASEDASRTGTGSIHRPRAKDPSAIRM